MDISEIVKSCHRPYLRRECEMIELWYEFGSSLRPSRMYPVVTCGPNAFVDFSEAGLRARDKELSQNCLRWLGMLKSDYPEIVAEFASVLDKAEQVWSGCVAA